MFEGESRFSFALDLVRIQENYSFLSSVIDRHMLNIRHAYFDCNKCLDLKGLDNPGLPQI